MKAQEEWKNARHKIKSASSCNECERDVLHIVLTASTPFIGLQYIMVEFSVYNLLWIFSFFIVIKTPENLFKKIHSEFFLLKQRTHKVNTEKNVKMAKTTKKHDDFQLDNNE